MIAYSVSLFTVAVIFLILGILIYRGNTGIIHDYHQTNVKASDKKKYGRSFAKAMFGISLTDEELKEVVGGRVTECCDTVKQEYTTVGCQFNNVQIDNSQNTGSKFTYNSAYSGGAIFPRAQNDQPGNDLQFK